MKSSIKSITFEILKSCVEIGHLNIMNIIQVSVESRDWILRHCNTIKNIVITVFTLNLYLILDYVPRMWIINVLVECLMCESCKKIKLLFFKGTVIKYTQVQEKFRTIFTYILSYTIFTLLASVISTLVLHYKV